MRPTFETVYMQLAHNLAQRSTCHRLAVGCVITDDKFRHVYGSGYNGSASGLPNGCTSITPGACGCLHAEANAVIKCKVPAEAPKVVLCTNLPCPTCAQYIVQLGGVQRVLWHEDYRVRDGVAMLERVGIKVQQFKFGTVP